VIHNFKERLSTIKKHHQKRLDEIVSIVTGSSLNTYQIARRMHWDVAYQSWEDFPLWQRMIASSEADAHLRYLTAQGRVLKCWQGQQAIYSAD